MKIIKMKKIAITLLALGLLFNSSLFAQDPKAKGILDKLSDKAKTYSSMSAKFDYTLYNKSENLEEVQHGSLMTQGEKYKFEIAGQVIISDGKTVWTVLEDAEEVQVNNVPTDEESEEYINPITVLTLWEKGFKFKYDKQETIEGTVLDIINLYPEKADEKSFHTVKLYVDQKKMEVRKIVIKGKDGTDFIYTIKQFEPNKNMNAQLFKFSTTEHPEFEVIDLR